MRKIAYLAGCALWTVAMTSPAVSQAMNGAAPAGGATGPGAQAPSAPSAAGPLGAPGEIIVTAQRRAQKINDVGMSITAATGATLVQRNITNVQGLTRIEPSLQFAQSNSGTPVYTIRGVGYFEQSLAATPTVSVYQDEVGYTYPIMSKGALLDVQRVEVLKGPQGTLYGQNATGGAINFIANRPSDHFEAGVTATWARFNAVQGEAYVTSPLTSDLSFRLAGRIERGGAWQESVTRDDQLGDRDFKTGRLLLDWHPDSRFKASLNVNGFIDKSDSQAGQLEGYHIQQPGYVGPLPPGGLNNPSAYLPNPALFDTYPEHIRDILSNPIPGHDDRAADWVAGTHPRLDEHFWQTSLRMDYDLSDAFGITSLTNYEWFKQADFHDISGIATVNSAGTFAGNAKTFSQEIRLHGVIADGKLNWLLGANYQHDRSNENDDLNEYFTSSSYLTGGSPFSPLPFDPFTQFGAINQVKVSTKSVFANAEYKFTPQLSAHAGIRYTKSDQDIGGCAYTDSVALSQIILDTTPGQCNTELPDGTRGLYRTTLDQHNVPWRVGIDFKPSRDNLIYVSVSKGYKAGASPALGAATYTQLTPVVQEALLAYEGGFKLSMFGHAVQLNGAYFHYDYDNKQELGRFIDPIFGALQALVNIPKSKEDGFELSTVIRPTSRITLNGAATYLKSKVTSHFLNFASYVASDGVTPPYDRIDFKGESFPFTPKWSFTYGARYDWPLSDRLNGFVEVDGTYQTKSNAAFGSEHAATEGPPLDIKGYGVVDLSAGVNTADNRWRFSVWGKNVFNTYYWTSVFYESDTTIRDTGMPATYGVTVGMHF